MVPGINSWFRSRLVLVGHSNLANTCQLTLDLWQKIRLQQGQILADPLQLLSQIRINQMIHCHFIGYGLRTVADTRALAQQTIGNVSLIKLHALQEVDILLLQEPDGAELDAKLSNQVTGADLIVEHSLQFFYDLIQSLAELGSFLGRCDDAQHQ